MMSKSLWLKWRQSQCIASASDGQTRQNIPQEQRQTDQQPCELTHS